MMNAIHFAGGVELSYPINLEVEGERCLVLGGGRVAHRKIVGLLEAGAEVIVIAPIVCEEIKRLIDQKKITRLERDYTVGCLPRGVLFIAATDNPKINRLAAIEAAEKNMLINVVDDAEPIENAIRFENPSTIRRGKFLLTISTGGASPALSRFMRMELEKVFDEDFGRRLEIISRLRDEVKGLISEPNERIEFWRAVMNEKIFSPTVDSETLEVSIRNALDSYRAQSQNRAD